MMKSHTQETMAQPEVSLAYRFVRGVFRLLVRLLADVDVQGFEKMPMEGPLLIAANHTTMLEGPIAFTFVPREPISVLAKQEWQGTLPGKLIDLFHPVYVSRGEIDRQAVRQLLKRLKHGEAFGIAPEGTRSKSGRLMKAKEGTAYLALKSRAWILPVAIWGQENVLSEWKRLRRPKIFLRVGEPFKVEENPALSRQEVLEAGTERIMCAIARLLPPEYRGYYAFENGK